MANFFKYFFICFLISSVNLTLMGEPPIKFVHDYFFAYMYNAIFGIVGGLSAMLGTDLYTFLKKKMK